MPGSTWEPHMFHGTLCDSAHDEKYPLTTAAATRSSQAAKKSVMVPPSDSPAMPIRAGSTSG